ncbi:MAG TPA: response regulator [Flavisolibacter sp.]|nr:response regulator [Flavisolibacter sp.]
MNPLKIVLYADDDIDDKTWVNEACKAANSSLEMKFVGNGREVLDYLSGMLPGEMPSLIVLDLNMPELDGRQTLKALKEHVSYQRIPVAVVTTSSSKIDREVCQRLGASVFLTKPDTYSEWQDIVRTLEPYVMEQP